MSDMRDPYEDQLAAARYRAERDQARQELARLKDRSRDTTVSAYDLLPEEDREALRWVRGHGGLDAVKERWHGRVARAHVEHMAEHQRERRERMQRHIECIQRLCRERREHIKGLNKAIAEMRPRLMPEGMEWLVEAWPRFEDDGPVRFLDDFERNGYKTGVTVVTMYSDGSFALNFRAYSKGERVNRPAHEMVDVNADAVRVGDKVYDVDTGDGPYEVFEIADGVAYLRGNDTPCYLPPNRITHRAPVLAADGRPLREGETVWHVKTGREYVVVEPSYGDTVVVRLAKYDDAEGEQYAPDQLTHERPVADSWERLEDDAGKDPCGYFGFDGEEICGKCPASGKNCEQTMALDIVRRARALAGVSE